MIIDGFALEETGFLPLGNELNGRDRVIQEIHEEKSQEKGEIQVMARSQPCFEGAEM